MILLRPWPYLSKLYLRASLIAPSLASAPEFAKKTLPMPVAVTSVFAVCTMGAVVNRLDTCMSLWICSSMAWVKTG